jgi:hypothetical protein
MLKWILAASLISLNTFATQRDIPPDIQMDRAVYGAEEKTYTVAEIMAEPTHVLIGGVVAEPGAFPASPWVGNCTAAIVGERVLFTAAHCVSNGGSKSFTVANTKYTAKCTHHSEYRNNDTADFAVCLTDKKVQGVPFEHVTVAVGYQKGDSILLSGYGCQKWGGGLDGKYRIGKAPVTRVPVGTDYDTVTVGSAALCSGDSGGPAFLVAADGSRKVIGVNSRSNTTTTSYLSSHGVSTAQNFYKSWAQANGAKICGIHPDAVGCRMSGPQKPVTFIVESSAVKYEVTVQPGSPSTVEHSKKSFQDGADYLGGNR